MSAPDAEQKNSLWVETRHRGGKWAQGCRYMFYLGNCNRHDLMMEESEEEGELPLTRTCAAIPNTVVEGDVCGAKPLP